MAEQSDVRGAKDGHPGTGVEQKPPGEARERGVADPQIIPAIGAAQDLHVEAKPTIGRPGQLVHVAVGPLEYPPVGVEHGRQAVEGEGGFG